MLFVWRKVGLFESSLRGTGEWNDTTRDNKYNPRSKNTPGSLFTEQERNLSLTASKIIFNDIKL